VIIGVTGDTHNNLKNIKQICSIFNKNRADLVLHTGDISLPKSLLAFDQLNCPLIAVFGNNDIGEAIDLRSASEQFDCKIYEEPFFFEVENRKICLLHHPDLIGKELLDKSDLIFHGHTHRFRKEKINNTIIFNPGECAGIMKGKNKVGLVNIKSLKIQIFKF